MRHYTKEQAISIVTTCAREYRTNLADRVLLVVSLDNKLQTSCIEFTFDASNFLHLTGLKLLETLDSSGKRYKLNSIQFYKRCLDRKLRVQDFDFSEDGTTPLKLDVLPAIINSNLSAKMIGDYNSANPKLFTEKLVGNVNACVGFVATPPIGRYVPNSVLKVDIRTYAPNWARIVAIFRKDKTDDAYSEITYKAKNVDWSMIKYPSKLSHLSTLFHTEQS